MDCSLTALGRALDFFGDHNAMARALGVTSRELGCARVRGKVSGELAERIDKLTFGAVRSDELRPDLYPRERHFNRVRVRRMDERKRQR